jgi:hypothetical protein
MANDRRRETGLYSKVSDNKERKREEEKRDDVRLQMERHSSCRNPTGKEKNKIKKPGFLPTSIYSLSKLYHIRRSPGE